MIRSETVPVQTLNRSNSETVSWRWNQICIDSFSDSDRLRIAAPSPETMFKPQELQFTFTAKRSCSQLLQSINSSWNFSEGRTHWSMMQSNTNVRRSEALLNEQQWQQIERLLEYWAVNHVTAVNPAALHWRNISTRSSWGTAALLSISVMCYSADEALYVFPACFAEAQDAAAAVASVPRSLAGLNPRWPLTHPASSSPAPPLESKSWAGRAVRLILQRSAEKREAAETRRASLRDQLKHTNTQKTHFTSAATIFSGADAIMQTKSHHFICTVIHITAGVHITHKHYHELSLKILSISWINIYY